MTRILVAIDGSPCALKAVEYVSRYFSSAADLQVVLFHVLPYVPAGFWDDGHVLTSEEREERKKVIDTWMANQTAGLDPVFREAADVLAAGGIPRERVSVKSVSDSADTAESIIEEARAGGYQMLVMGRCGRSAASRFLLGSVTGKVINRGAGIPLCVVEQEDKCLAPTGEKPPEEPAHR